MNSLEKTVMDYRREFYDLKQGDEESLLDYAARIRRASSFCQFDDSNLDFSMKVRLIHGLLPGQLKTSLMEQDHLESFDSLLLFASSGKSFPSENFCEDHDSSSRSSDVKSAAMELVPTNLHKKKLLRACDLSIDESDDGDDEDFVSSSQPKRKRLRSESAGEDSIEENDAKKAAMVAAFESAFSRSPRAAVDNPGNYKDDDDKVDVGDGDGDDEDFASSSQPKRKMLRSESAGNESIEEDEAKKAAMVAAFRVRAMEMDVAAFEFTLRKGIGWEVEPYRKLISALCCDSKWINRDLENLSGTEIADLANISYPKWSKGRSKYYDSLFIFLKNYKKQIEEDCNLFKHDYEIIPPELNAFRILVGTIVKVMLSERFEEEVDNFLRSDNDEIALDIRKSIAQSIVDSEVNKDENRHIFRKVSRLFKDHFEEMRNVIRIMKNKGINNVTNVSGSRRSARLADLASRKPESEVIESKIRLCIESDFKKEWMGEVKGFGVIAMCPFKAGDFLLEYAGELMSRKDGRNKHELYSYNANIGSFIFDFKFQDKYYSIDATTCETNRLGRFVNHSMKIFNAKVKILVVCGRPRLLLFAMKDIKVGDELLYDYGDRSPESIRNHPWLLE